MPPNDVCMFTSQDQQDRVNVELMKLGIRGTTVVVPSGDGGSHFSFMPYMTENSTLQALNNDLNTVSCEYNIPTFPCDSPFVLTTGGTQWTDYFMGMDGTYYGPTCSASKPCGSSLSGGGFSWGNR